MESNKGINVIKNMRTSTKIAICVVCAMALVGIWVGINYVNKMGLSDGILFNVVVSVGKDQISIRNNNTYDWDNVNIILNTKFKLHEDSFGSGETRNYDIKEFSSSSGERFDNNAYKVIRVRMTCSGNRVPLTYEFTVK